MLPARKPLRSNTYLEPSATLRMNYRDWHTIWPNGWMFIQDEQSAGGADPGTGCDQLADPLWVNRQPGPAELA